MIIVTGATGQLGSQIVQHLLARVPAEQIGVSVRDPRKAHALRERGVRVRRGDFAEPDTLPHAFEGASQVLVVSGDTIGAEAVAQSTSAIDAAYAAGAHRVLYTSHQATRPDATWVGAHDHAAVEAHLQAAGRPYVALRNGYYATTSLNFHIGDAAQTGKLIAPVDGPVSWTAPADLAEGAAVILTGQIPFDGPTPPLTASEAIDLEHVAALLSEIHGRAIRRVVVDDDEFVAHLTQRGTPEPFAHLFLSSFTASRNGDFDVVDPTLESLLEHPTTPVRSVLASA